MKHENKFELNVPAFAIAGGMVGLLMGVFMMGGGGMMGGFYGGMMGGYGGGFIGIGMAVFAGIVSGVFALLYNWLTTKMN